MKVYNEVKNLLDSAMVSAGINSYESLPTRSSPRTLISKPKDEDEYDKDESYPFMTLGRINTALTKNKKNL